MPGVIIEEEANEVSLTKEQFELEQLRHIKAKVIRVEAEMAVKDKRIAELELEVHNLMTDLYNYDIHIDGLTKALENKAEDSKATIAKIKTKLTYQIDVSQLPRIQAVAALARPDQPIRLLFNSVTGQLMEVGL